MLAAVMVRKNPDHRNMCTLNQYPECAQFTLDKRGEKMMNLLEIDGSRK